MADTDVQGMLVRIEATTAQLRQELTRSEGSVSSTAHNIDQSLGRIDNAFDRVNASAQTVGRAVTSAFDQIGAGNLAAAGSIAGLVALTTSTIDYAKEVKNLSALSNTTVEDFQRMAFGAKTVGVEQDKLGDILKDTNDRVGEFLQRGGGEMSDFFKEIAPKIGVTAGQFANLSGPQALQLYYTSLEKAGLNQQQMTTYMEAMADETTALIPLLRNNGKGFKEWGDQAERAGSVISEFNVNRLVAAGQAISGLKATFSGAANQITIGLLPGIESITKSLQGLSDNGGAKRLGETISFLAENVDVLVAALGGKMAAAFAKFAIDAVASSATATKAMLTNIATTKASAIAKAEETAASAAATAAKLRESVAAYSAAQALEAETIARLAQVQAARQALAYQASLAVGTVEETRYTAALAAMDVELAAAKTAAAAATQRLTIATAASSSAMARDTAATTANAAAQAQAAAAKNVLARASSSLLALLGGPAGIAALAIGVGVAFLAMGSNAQTARTDVNDLKRSVEEVRKEFAQLTRDQQQGALVRITEQQRDSAKEAADAFQGLRTSMQRALVGPRSSEAGGKQFAALTSSMEEARKAGQPLSDAILKVGQQLGIPQKQLDGWVKQSEVVSTLDVNTSLLAARQELYTKQLDGSTKSTKDKNEVDIAAENAGKNYQQTLDKQIHALKDKTKLEEADRFITENKIDPQGALAKQIRDTAKAYDAQKDADKSATESAQKHKEAQNKLEQQLKTAADAYAKLKESFDPVSAAADEQKKKTEELRLLYKSGKISTEEYGQGLKWLQQQYDQTVASADGMAEAMKYEADLQRQLALATASYEQSAAAVGMGSKEAERAQARLSLEQDTNNKVLALRTELATATTDKQRQALETQIALTQQYGAKQLAAMQQGYVNLDAAQGDWKLGAKSAFADYLESAKDVAGQTKAAFTSAFGTMEDSLNTFATTGKFKFSDFATSIITDMGRIASRKASSALLEMLFNAGVSSLGSSGGGNGLVAGSAGAASSNLGASQAGYSATYFPQAKGGAWSGGVQMFAEGAAFTNSIVSTPTAFSMAGGGAGVMGEAGPEAIMPLARSSDGSLGVRMVGGAATSGGTVVKVEAPVYLTLEDRSGEGMEIDSAALQQNMQRQMLGVAQKAIADSWRPGGTSHRNTSGRG
ncbi:phage tail tape measure protein [Pseudomonas ficuserectae]|uniref:Phage tail tape measure protein n=1 Tax=Pseudomonas amygdali pv. lachrymans TaxID=53707 RepID=A0AB37R2W2_PSEAV|nr:phage tail tape measure protein [Pseudomonas amygdali]KKY57448.1 tail protein [Pseudomonas amygdali pv. lachrymans]KPC01783.1 Phage tail tape measure protein [Pseudomonas amygdali pv. lachrymans]KPC19926.1 Phage tail tape measure protein [Pseudomonas amygdali pv. lachrymans]RMM51619.1 Phage tail tape measure protein [Pseudomonas amygdali pv. lachrymans]RMT20473.1 Phage tail tape measure protein [Pseudomonas amygdali pv. lachrymans]